MGVASFKLEGVERLQRKVASLPRAVAGKISRKAVNAGGTIVLQAGRRGVRVRTKQLKKSLGRKGKTGKNGYFNVIGPRLGFRQVDAKGKPYDPAFTAHIVEGGAAPHKIVIRRRRGKVLRRPQVVRHPGSRPRPFMRPALEDNRAAVQGAIAAKMREGLETEARR